MGSNSERARSTMEKLSFTKEEDERIELGSSSMRAAKEAGKNCMLMKVLSYKSISLEA